MSKIYSIIEAIAATPKLTEKEQILRSTIGTDQEELIKSVFKAAYDESINYWVKEFPFPEKFLAITSFEFALSSLSEISQRNITGNAAINFVSNLTSHLTEQDAIILDRVIKRDLRCGATATMANKVWPDLIPTVPYMRCSSFNEKNLKAIKFKCYSQTKEDGLYLDIIVANGEVRYQTRTGQKLLLNEPVRDANLLAFNRDFVLMGEGLVVNDDGTYMSRKEGNGILNSDDIPMDKVRFVLWDYVPFQDWKVGKSDMIYNDRLFSLMTILSSDGPKEMILIDTRVVNNIEEVIEHFKENVALEKEGTVVKNFDGLWKDGTSKDQVKVKIIFSTDLLIVDAKEGKGKHKGKLGAFLVRSSDGLVECWVGGGYKDPDRVKYWKEKDQMIGSSIMEVLGNDLITDRNRADIYSIFLPRCKEVRGDKTEADSLDRVREQRNACVNVLRAIGR